MEETLNLSLVTVTIDSEMMEGRRAQDAEYVLLITASFVTHS